MDSKRIDIFMLALTKSQKSMAGIVKEIMREDNIKHIEVLCLKSIAFIEGGVSASDLCKMCFYDKAIISRTLNSLKGEYIYINPQDENKTRGRRYLLTQKGRAVCDKMSRFMNTIGEELTHNIPEEDVEVFFRTALKILDNMQNMSINLNGQEAKE